MFTGIIEETGTVLDRGPGAAPGITDLTLRAGPALRDLEAGASLAVDGVCLTALPARDPGTFRAEMMAETLDRTTLGALVPGDRVNLERCTRAGDCLDGHIVQGHVDAVGSVLAVEPHGGWTTLRIALDPRLSPLVVEKGSIAVAGVSLTLTAVSPAGAEAAWFEVGIIPLTQERTTLGTLAVGDRVNLETDVLARHVQRLAQHARPVDAGTPEGVGVPASSRLAAALRALREGRPVLVSDDADREDEADLVLAARTAAPSTVGFLVRHTSGVLCAPMPSAVADRLGLAPMVADNRDPKGTAYTVSCDALGVGTGISAADRALTARTLADPAATAAALTRPGHLFPLVAVEGGVRQRPGHTEAAVELCRRAGAGEVALIAELVDDDGAITTGPAVRAFAALHGIPLLSIAELREHLPAEGEDGSAEPLDLTDPVHLPTPAGRLRARGARIGEREHLVLSDPAEGVAAQPGGSGSDPEPAPLVRVHSECLTGDVLGSRRCDCGEQLQVAIDRCAREGGVVLYLRGHEGRGIGLHDKLRAYALQDAGADTVDANLALGLPVDARDYGDAARILHRLGIDRIRLLTNNPAKARALEAAGIAVEMVPLAMPAGADNHAYLAAKRDRLDHRLPHLLDLTQHRTPEETP